MNRSLSKAFNRIGKSYYEKKTPGLSLMNRKQRISFIYGLPVLIFLHSCAPPQADFNRINQRITNLENQIKSLQGSKTNPPSKMPVNPVAPIFPPKQQGEYTFFAKNKNFAYGNLQLKRDPLLEQTILLGFIASGRSKKILRFTIESYDENGVLLSFDLCVMRNILAGEERPFQCILETGREISLMIYRVDN